MKRLTVSLLVTFSAVSKKLEGAKGLEGYMPLSSGNNCAQVGVEVNETPIVVPELSLLKNPRSDEDRI